MKHFGATKYHLVGYVIDVKWDIITMYLFTHFIYFVIECKTRWRSIRDLYHRKRKDEKKGKHSRSQWEYMETLSFLEDFTTEKKSDANADIPSDEEESSSRSNEHFPQNYMNLIALPFSIGSEINNYKRPSDEEPLVGAKKIKCEPTEADPKTEHETVRLLRDIRDATQVIRHPIQMFFDSMANTVMGFPPALAAEAKLKVCQIVTELECRILDEAGMGEAGEPDATF
ncbi:hypothetical protein NQ317_007853 [Molorchus minor]|uniref:MADF domain-containing protein n=1 Tax=Molorchus minor TaxID=1323400 RepID=A0ABQ9JRY9_9CUCU|nr:hypothetical protein NQ317_007853 [Molorchus minor]